MYLTAIYTQSAIYDGLTNIAGNGNVIPWLASSGHATSPTTWEFTLRDGVRFSNGEPFDAAAVASAVEVLTRPASSGWALARELATLKSARVIAPNVGEITTDEPNPMSPRELAWLLLPAPEAWHREYADSFAARPVGTGPYQLTEWHAGREQFDRFEGSWGRPVVPHLEFRQIPDNAARVQALVSDQIDAIIIVNPDDRAVVLPSLTLLGIARDVWRLPERCLHYVPNGFPCAKFDRAAVAGFAAKIVGTVPVIGTVAALRKDKALDRLIRAFAIVRKQAPARLAIVGEGGERPL